MDFAGFQIDGGHITLLVLLAFMVIKDVIQTGSLKNMMTIEMYKMSLDTLKEVLGSPGVREYVKKTKTPLDDIALEQTLGVLQIERPDGTTSEVSVTMQEVKEEA